MEEANEEPIFEYIYAENESGILEIIFDELFEQIEKEIRKRI